MYVKHFFRHIYVERTRMHSSRMRNARSLPYRGGLCQGVPLPPPRGQTDTCEIITLPQTSFAGGNYWIKNTGRVLFPTKANIWWYLSKTVLIRLISRKNNIHKQPAYVWSSVVEPIKYMHWPTDCLVNIFLWIRIYCGLYNCCGLYWSL